MHRSFLGQQKQEWALMQITSHKVAAEGASTPDQAAGKHITGMKCNSSDSGLAFALKQHLSWCQERTAMLHFTASASLVVSAAHSNAAIHRFGSP